MSSYHDEFDDALPEAASVGNLQAVKFLLRAGADSNCQNIMNGWTSLHWAACRGHVEVVKYLLDYGVDTTIKNSQGNTAVDLATNQEIRTLLGVTNEGTSELTPIHVQTPSLPITPNYLIHPPVEKLWGLPDEIVHAMTQHSKETLTSYLSPPSHLPTPGTSTPGYTPSDTGVELLVYIKDMNESCLLGSVFSESGDTLATLEQHIHDEIDDAPASFTLGKFTGNRVVPVNKKQMGKRVQQMFRNEDAVVILPGGH